MKPRKDILFHVRLDHNSQIVLGYLSGNMRRNRIRVVLGDRVKIEISELDSKKGRIFYRLSPISNSQSQTGIKETTDDPKAMEMENAASPESLLDTESTNPMSSDSSQLTEERDSKDTKPNQG